MLIIISPAKTLDFETPVTTRKHTQPQLLDDSRQLVSRLRELTPDDLSSLMNVSPKIAELNFSRYLDWETPFSPANARQAVFAFKGDVYAGLQADEFDTADLDFAQKHLRILSGLYGVLRPLDLIQPYRLEMGTRLANSRGDTLYDFWGSAPTAQLNKALKGDKHKVLVNLASNEYFKAVKKNELEADVVTPVFKDYKNGQYKVISFYAKKARGMMAAYIIRNRVEKVADLKKFTTAGYKYNAGMSSDSEPVFTRKQA